MSDIDIVPQPSIGGLTFPPQSAPTQPPPAQPPGLQQRLAQILGVIGGAGKMMQSVGGGGSGSGATTQGASMMQMPQGAAPPLPPGSMAAGLPQYSPGAQPVQRPPAIGPQGMPANQSGYNFQTPKARNAAIVTNTIQSLGQFVDKLQEHKYQKQVEEARGVVATVLRSGLAAQNTQDPDTKKLIQENANKMLGSKEAQKVLKNLNKPGSAAYYGAQQAYQDVINENAQKLSMQELQARMQAEQARAEAERQRAAAEAQRQRSESPEGKIQIAHAAHADEMEKVSAQQTAMNARVDAQQKGAMDRTIQAGKDALKVAQTRIAAIKAATDPKISKALTDQYNALRGQWEDLSKRATAMQKDLSDHPVQNWNSPEAQVKKGQISGILLQQKDLEQQMQLITAKQAKLLQFGLIDQNEAPPPSTAQPTTPSVDTSSGDGSEDNPIVVK
jgi:hypothetical protein